jgi:hypothetical protein
LLLLLLSQKGTASQCQADLIGFSVEKAMPQVESRCMDESEKKKRIEISDFKETTERE